jgi:GntR family transcriptional regulator
MNIILSNTSEKPLYQQIYEQIRSQIIRGELESGFCLPPIRTVAKELRISVITVKGAWDELERGGLICSITGKGCFVAPLKPNELDSRRNQLAIDRLSQDIEYYKSLGLTKSDLIDLVRKYFKE